MNRIWLWAVLAGFLLGLALSVGSRSSLDLPPGTVYYVFEVEVLESGNTPAGTRFTVALVDPDPRTRGYRDGGSLTNCPGCQYISDGKDRIFLTGPGNAGLPPGKAVTMEEGKREVFEEGGFSLSGFDTEHSTRSIRGSGHYHDGSYRPARVAITLKKKCEARLYEVEHSETKMVARGIISLPETTEYYGVEMEKPECFSPEDIAFSDRQ